jgi:NAD(P)-dependent dehydrogenase (short-subunit alcohol dehydrogenase family)
MKIILIGATGTIGKEVAAQLAARHDVVRVHRHGDLRADIEDAASIAALYDRVGDFDAVVCCAGGGRFGPLAKLTDADFEYSLRSKLMGQVNVVRLGLDRIRDGGSFTLTSGVLATKPAPGSAALSPVNAAVDAFARAAALELPRGLRVNVVSPPWVQETLVALGRDPAPGLPAAQVARAYVAAVEGTATGQVISP